MIAERTLASNKSPELASYEILEATLVARIPSLPLKIARLLMSAPDPLRLVRRFYGASRFFQAAIATASPSLSAACEADWRSGVLTPRVWLSATRYAVRSGDRTTPYGLFAAVAPIRIGASTDLEIVPDSFRLAVRPDMAWTARAVAEVEKATDPSRRRYTINEMIVEYGQRLAVSQADRLESGVPGQFHTVSLRNTPLVDVVRRLAGTSRTRAEIEGVLIEAGSSESRAASLVDTLLNVGFLQSALRLPPLGKPFERVIELSRDAAGDLSERLVGVQKACEEAGSASTATFDVDMLTTVRSKIREAIPSDGLVDLLQVDSYISTRGTLGRALKKTLEENARFALATARHLPQDRFVEAFYERYESYEQWVPLLDFVDPLGGTLFRNKVYAPSPGEERIARLFTRWSLESMRLGALEIQATPDDMTVIERCASESPSPAAFELSFEVAAESAAAIDAGRYTVLPGTIRAVHGAGRTLGRFLSNLPTETLQTLREIRTAEEDVVDAELVYKSPRERYENVAIRPRVHDVEVQIGLFDDFGITRVGADDLWIRVEGGAFVVRSKRLGRRLLLKQTHVFEPGTAGPVVDFLIAICEDRRIGMMPPLPAATAVQLGFHPRVRRGRTVLVPARWYVPTAELAPREVGRTISWLREHRMLPETLLLCDDDNKLRVNVLRPEGVELLVAHARRLQSELVVLEEARDDTAWLRAGKHGHRAEFVATYRRKPYVASATASKPCPELQRRTPYSPSSAWSSATLELWRADDGDRFLRDRLSAIVAEAKKAGADRWFFVRYRDGGRHTLRVRARTAFDTPDAANALLDAMTTTVSALVREGELRSFDLSTYEPETGRYGGLRGVDLAEQLFAIDSESTLERFASAIPTASLGRLVEAAVTLDDLLFGAAVVDGSYPWLDAERRKLTNAERSAVAQIAGRIAERRRESGDENRAVRSLIAEQAGLAEDLGAILRAVTHMHFNRWGVHGEDERAALALFRAAVLRTAKKLPP